MTPDEVADPSAAGNGTDAAQAQPRPPLAKVPDWLMRTGVSAWLIIGVIALAVALYLGLSQITTLVAPLIVAVVMGMLFYPLVDRLARLGLRRALSASLILIGLAVIVVFSIFLAVRGIFDQGPEIAEQLEQGWLRAQELMADFGVDVEAIQEALSSLTASASSGIGSVVTATVSSVGFLLVGLFIGTFILYYLLKDWEVLSRWAATHMGLPTDLATGLVQDTTDSIRRYFYALTLTSIPIALTIGLAMYLLGLPLAVTIALVTFVTAYIPYLGAIFSGAFATLIALGSGGLTEALIVLAVVLLTQNVMQTLLLTRLASSQLNLHPIVNLGSTIVGASVAGILGATLSAPFVASVVAAQRRLREYRWGAAEEEPAKGAGELPEAAQDQSASSPERR